MSKTDMFLLRELKDELRCLAGKSQNEDDVSNWINAINNLIEENNQKEKQGAIKLLADLKKRRDFWNANQPSSYILADLDFLIKRIEKDLEKGVLK